MQERPYDEVIAQLYADRLGRVVYACAGGGTRLIDWLFSVPGASSTMLEARVVYAPKSMERFVGRRDAGTVTMETTDRMLREAFNMACDMTLGESLSRPTALVVNAALATNRERRGEDHYFVGVHVMGVPPEINEYHLNRTDGRDLQEMGVSERALGLLNGALRA